MITERWNYGTDLLYDIYNENTEAEKNAELDAEDIIDVLDDVITAKFDKKVNEEYE